jgi:hypothetical protein
MLMDGAAQAIPTQNETAGAHSKKRRRASTIPLGGYRPLRSFGTLSESATASLSLHLPVFSMGVLKLKSTICERCWPRLFAASLLDAAAECTA